jgi:hypothetical protein
MLFHSCSVRAVGNYNLASSIDVILLYQLVFVLIKILSVGNFLLECLIGEPCEEVFLGVELWSGRGSVMEVLEL